MVGPEVSTARLGDGTVVATVVPILMLQHVLRDLLEARSPQAEHLADLLEGLGVPLAVADEGGPA